MKFPRSVPMQVFVGVVIFFVLLWGSYMVGSTRAVSSQPVYITDGSGGNAASVNQAGHLSVHLADGGLPAFAGPLYSRHLAFPRRHGLAPGQCYAAFIRGGGSFESAAVHFNGDGGGRPEVLVRIDPAPVWAETGSAGSTPPGPGTGFQRLGATDVFGFTYSLSFKAFAGVLLCWHGRGTSDSFVVQMTVANGGGRYHFNQEELFIKKTGDTFAWRKLQGPKPQGYRIMVTKSTLVSNLVRRGPDVPPDTKCSPSQCLHRAGKRVKFVPHQYRFSVTVPLSKVVYPRYYLLELQGQGPGIDPTRVGPFGDWTGE